MAGVALRIVGQRVCPGLLDGGGDGVDALAGPQLLLRGAGPAGIGGGRLKPLMRRPSSSSQTLDLAVGGVVAVTDAPVDRLVLPLCSLLLDLTKEQAIVELTGGSPLRKALAVDPRLGRPRRPGHVLRISLASCRLSCSPVLPAQLGAVALQTPTSSKSRSYMFLLNQRFSTLNFGETKVKVTWSLLAASSPRSPFTLLKLRGVPGTEEEGSARLGCDTARS